MSFTPEELELNESDDEQYYEEVYFDSDLDNEIGEVDNEQSNPTDLIKKSRKKLTKEELFYDPEMDDDDEIWMKKKMAQNCKINRSERLIYTDKENSKSSSKSKNKRLSDKQKQRPNSTDVELDVKNDDTLEKSTTIKEEIYYPVECEICGTKVAVVDEEEIFHFFNVIPS
ncbi:13193_t:CDS:2 [Gigaspora rosea]|nr:13193_t:CDS:2 [Gigaspora rosea]